MSLYNEYVITLIPLLAIMNENITIDLKVPFPSNRLAQIAYDVLRVDKEPKRSGVSKQLSVENNTLIVNFSANLARQLRVAVTSFFESINLIIATMDFAGPPVSERYDYS